MADTKAPADVDTTAPTESYRAEDYDQLNAPEGNLDAGQAGRPSTDEYRSHDYDDLVKSGAIVVGTAVAAGDVRPSETVTYGEGGTVAVDNSEKSVTADDAETKDVKPSDQDVETK